MLKYLKVILLDGPIIIFSYFSWMIRFAKHPEKYPRNVRYQKLRYLVLRVLKHFNVDIVLNDFDSFIKNSGKNRLIVCNHLSLLDPLIFIAISPKPVSFACKNGVKKMPIIPKVVDLLEGIYLDRSDLKQQLREMKKIEQAMVEKDGLDWCIFPEGTRNKTDERKPGQFHHGTFRCATKTKSNILIMSLFGTHQVLNSRDHSKKYIVKVQVLKELSPNDYSNLTTNDIAVLAQEEVEKGLTNI